MNKREETAARAAAMLEAGEDPRTVAAACGYKTTSGMLGAISLIRNRKEARETAPETAQEKPERRAEEIRPELEQAFQAESTAAEARESTMRNPAPVKRSTLAELLEQEKVLLEQREALQKQIGIARIMEAKAARTVAENERFRGMRPEKAGDAYVISTRNTSGRRIFVRMEDIDDLRKVVEAIRADMAKCADAVKCP